MSLLSQFSTAESISDIFRVFKYPDDRLTDNFRLKSPKIEEIGYLSDMADFAFAISGTSQLSCIGIHILIIGIYSSSANM